MRAGLLRKVLIIEAFDLQALNDGSQEVTFEPYTVAGKVQEVFARVEPLRADEFVIAEQDTSRTWVRITLRYRSNLPPTYQLRDKYADRVFEITGVLNLDERNHILQVLATEKPGS
jgi:SPP1 family predicted phage head-tail adaptor